MQRSERAQTIDIPGELLGSLPRDVRLASGGIVLVTIALLLTSGALVSAILLSIAYQRGVDQRELRAREGMSAQAEVLDVTLRRGEHPRRIVTYAYEVEGRRFTGTTSFSQNARRDIITGGLVNIAYLRSEPGRSWIPGREPTGVPMLLIPFVPAALLLGAAGITWGVRRQWILLSEGRAARARIVGHTRVQHDERRMNKVTFEFQTLSGAMRTGSYESAKTPPPVGTLIPIVYHRDDPRWTSRYPLALVRPQRSHWSIRRRAPLFDSSELRF